MITTLIFLANIFFLTNSHPPPPPLPTVPIKYTSSGYLVTVAIRSTSQSPLNASNIQPSDNFDLLLSLYDTNTLLPGNCLGFTNVNSSHNLGVDNEEVMTYGVLDYFPYFNFANPNGVFIQFYLSSHYYSDNFLAMVTSNCTNGNPSYGSGAMGILGMTFAETEDYYHQDPEEFSSPIIFSIYLNGYGQDGQLIFGNNLTAYAQSINPVAQLVADLEFKISVVTATIQVGSTVFNQSFATIIFDINANAIGFPSAIFNIVINALNTAPGVSCPTNVFITPTCNYTGPISSLPTISITAGGQTVPIPPQAYAQANTTAGTITLNINGLSSTDVNAANYVTQDWVSTIILDSHVMACYYIVFSQGDTDETTNITMFIPVQNFPPSKNVIIFIVIGVVVALVLVGALFWFYKKRLARLAKQKESSNQVEITSFQSFESHRHHENLSTGQI